ncbi:hypothetical protein [Reichenbachiella versicolor]|uniref:hypothetical protein n=1 Tax=Reichenbachiella versicolor TaxID=1821036 RepID=UPI0013A54234|nr:hypothetical protein [Reichenbachiella versicolor]
MRHLLIIAFVLSTFLSYSQADTIPQLVLKRKFYQTQIGESVYFEINKTTAGSHIEMDNAPEGAMLDSTKFSWEVPNEYVGQNIIIDFRLVQDGKLLDKNSVFISIDTETNPPTFLIESNLPDDKGIYHLTPDTKLTLKITAESQVSRKKDKVSFDYFFNENKNLKSLDSVSINIDNNVLTLEWTPLRSQLDDKYYSLTVLAVDEEHQVNEKNILFILNRNNQPPYFIYPVMDEYYISPSEKLEIDLAARDPEGDSLLYKLDIPTKMGNPKLSGDGKFTWKLNQDQIMRLRRFFPVEVTVEATEISSNNPHTIIKRFKIQKNVRNQPPKILNLQNQRIKEGLTFQKTVFIQDGNDDPQELEIDIRGAPKGMDWTFKDNMLNIEWTPGFDVVGVEMKPESFDMLLIVKDPFGYVDQRAFTITVEHREDTELTYRTYMEYRNDAVQMVEVLSQINAEMQDREYKVQTIKKGLSIVSMFSATYTAMGNVYEEDGTAQKLVPYVGAVAIIAGGINAFGFNDFPKYVDLREKSYVLHQKLRYVLGVLGEYRIDGPNSPNLENAEFRDQLRSFEQSMINDKLDFKRYYAKFHTLNYVKKRMSRERRIAAKYNRKPQGILFLDMDEF